MLEMQSDQAKLKKLDLEGRIEDELTTIAKLEVALERECEKHTQFLAMGSGCHESHLRHLASSHQLIEQKNAHVLALKASLVEVQKTLRLLNAKEQVVKENMGKAERGFMLELDKKWDQMCGEIAAINQRRSLV